MEPSWWVDEPNTRGTYNLVSSCVFTLGLCVWTAIHLNIPEQSPRAGARQFMRKMIWLTVGLLAPEVVTFVAWNQYSVASRVVISLGGTRFNLRRKARSVGNALFRLVGRSESIKRSAGETSGPPLSLTHGFYVVMGGYALDITISDTSKHFLRTAAGVKRLTLTPDGLLFLMKHAPELVPRISEEDIEDKSKADGLAKLLVALQALWFCLQCISRAAQHLPISLLEITTVGHALYTLFTYVLWAYKPMNITVPTTIPLEGGANQKKLHQLTAYMFMCSSISGQAAARAAGSPGIANLMSGMAECEWVQLDSSVDTSSAPASKPRPGEKVVLRAGSPGFPRTGLSFISTDEMHFHEARRRLHFKAGMPARYLNLHARDVRRWQLTWDAITSFNRDGMLDLEPKEYLVTRASDVPTYFSWRDSPRRMVFGFTIAEVIYGLIHAAGWNTHFASPGLKLAWRAAACGISGGGLFLGAAFMWAAGEASWYDETLSAVVVVGAIELVIRTFLLVEAVLNVGVLPNGVYDLPQAISFIPHWALIEEALYEQVPDSESAH